MEPSVYQKIIDRELPAHIVYEDENTLAFLDINPVSIGHTLVIPKVYADNVFDISEASWLAVMQTVHTIAPIIRDVVGAAGVHINSNHGVAAGQEVPHLHIHIIPRPSNTEIHFWPTISYADGQAAQVAQAIADRI